MKFGNPISRNLENDEINIIKSNNLNNKYKINFTNILYFKINNVFES